jgi:hypothetical protein
MQRETSSNPHTARTRDAALRRLSHANRWLLAGSAALAGVFTAAAAQAFSGHKAPARDAARRGADARAAARREGTGTSSTTTASAPLQAPAQTPSSVSSVPSESASVESAPVEPAPVVSGGS